MSEVIDNPRATRQATREAWSERLARFADSGLTVASFCAAEAVSAPSFFYWKRQLSPGAGAEAPSRFLPVVLTQASAPVEVVLPDGVVLRLGPGCDLALVRSLIAALTEPPC